MSRKHTDGGIKHLLLAFAKLFIKLEHLVEGAGFGDERLQSHVLTGYGRRGVVKQSGVDGGGEHGELAC